MQELGAADPRRIGPYELLGRLGSGGMGRVFLGRSAVGALAAVKVVHADLARDPEFRRRFQREVSATITVSGPHVAAVVHADTEAEQPWLATEYVPGPSLAAEIDARGTLPPAEVAVLGTRLAGALATIHAAGLVHRDVKPSNILLSGDGPKLIDFGIARDTAHSRMTRTGMAMGTPLFMAPEQIQGDADAGPEADVFALAGVLVHAATGGYPFGEGTPVKLLYRIVHDQPRLDGVAAELRPVLAACLDKDPAMRPSAREVARALLLSTQASPVPGGPEAATERLIGGSGPATAAETSRLISGSGPADSDGTARSAHSSAPTSGSDAGATARNGSTAPATMPAVPSPGAPGLGTSADLPTAPGSGSLADTQTVAISRFGAPPTPNSRKRNQKAYIFTGAGVAAALVALVVLLSGAGGIIGGSQSDAHAGRVGTGLTDKTASDTLPGAVASGQSGTGTAPATSGASSSAGPSGTPTASGTASSGTSSSGTSPNQPSGTGSGRHSAGSTSAPASGPGPHSGTTAAPPPGGGTSGAPVSNPPSTSASSDTPRPPLCNSGCTSETYSVGTVHNVNADSCVVAGAGGSTASVENPGSCSGTQAQWRVWRSSSGGLMLESTYYPGYCLTRYSFKYMLSCDSSDVASGWWQSRSVGKHSQLQGGGLCASLNQSSGGLDWEDCQSPAVDWQLWDV